MSHFRAWSYRRGCSKQQLLVCAQLLGDETVGKEWKCFLVLGHMKTQADKPFVFMQELQQRCSG